MENTSLEKERIHADYSGESVPESVKNFRPDVYRDGDQYICILGDSNDGVFGSGDSVEEAMKKWDEAYWKKMPAKND